MEAELRAPYVGRKSGFIYVGSTCKLYLYVMETEANGNMLANQGYVRIYICEVEAGEGFNATTL